MCVTLGFLHEVEILVEFTRDLLFLINACVSYLYQVLESGSSLCSDGMDARSA